MILRTGREIKSLELMGLVEANQLWEYAELFLAGGFLGQSDGEGGD